MGNQPWLRLKIETDGGAPRGVDSARERAVNAARKHRGGIGHDCAWGPGAIVVHQEASIAPGSAPSKLPSCIVRRRHVRIYLLPISTSQPALRILSGLTHWDLQVSVVYGYHNPPSIRVFHLDKPPSWASRTSSLCTKRRQTTPRRSPNTTTTSTMNAATATSQSAPKSQSNTGT
jgi:hypothetical protein